MSLILASQSPRRKALLSSLGVSFAVQAADIDETPMINEPPMALAKRLAEQKANHVYQQSTKNTWVLGGDTVVAIGEHCLGKPSDRSEAIDMLRQLSANTHMVISAVSLLGPDFNNSIVVQTTVTFGDITDAQINQYCDSDEPYDKAGAYGIQGLGGIFVKSLNGSYSNVVGLPLYETRLLLVQSGLISSY